MASNLSYAEGLAGSLPVCDQEGDSDLISLCDIVVTGLETEWYHFEVVRYMPNAGGVVTPWATIKALQTSGQYPKMVDLNATTVRSAVVAYLESRLEAGMDPVEAAKLVDGSYTDALVADAICQWALYGEVIYG